jgi:DNA polymerase-3 subunit alpha (Gram-positive type)
MLALEKSKCDSLKVLYGMEAYFVNDTNRFVFGAKYPSFDDEMVAFDLETTGLSAAGCKIIEIGAVKIKSGKVIDEMDTVCDEEGHVFVKMMRMIGVDPLVNMKGA